MRMPWTRQSRSQAHLWLHRDGVTYTLLGAGGEWWLAPYEVPEESRPLAAYLAQLVNEGKATISDGAVALAWGSYFELAHDDAHAQSLPLLALPSRGDWRPVLESRGTPSEEHFTLAITTWQSPSQGERRLSRTGGILADGASSQWLMHEAAWRLCEQIVSFAACSASMSAEDRMHELGRIRSLALSANALLDDYLQNTHIVSPQHLTLDLVRHQALGAPVVEVTPHLSDTPANFVESFDRYDAVRKRYDVAQPDGSLLHVSPAPAVSAALQAIKAMPGRRVSSDEARLFAHNPFAVLGEEARDALDEAALIEARHETGLLPYRLEFHPSTEGEAPSLALVHLADAAEPVALQVSLGSAKALLGQSAKSRAKALPLFHWDGYEIELGAATEAALAQLAQWVALRETAQALSFADVMNLEAYSDRVIGFDAKVQVVPYVAKQAKGPGWIPENTQLGVATVDRETGSIEHVPLSSEDVGDLRERVARAREEGVAEVTLTNSEVAVPLERAQQLADTLEAAEISIGKRQAPALRSDPKNNGKRPALQIYHNIEDLDYVVASVGAFEAAANAVPEIPQALRAEVELLPHQREGLAWLQHRYGLQDEGVSGCLLADDMGLGKTLQSLCLIAWHRERNESARPCLIVAPVSLLENWKLEIEKFLAWEPGVVLSLYGEALGRLRLGGASIDPELSKAGVRKLLRPGFEQGYNVVLTTYETLRDYEFSLARVNWGVVVCDEAQKIKNPAAFVTQAAKALRADFRVACTGTPVENSLADLWCLFDFFQPGLLGSLNEFTKVFRRAIETRTDGHAELIERLRATTRPWVLRRMKTEVHQGLPAKIEGADADAESEALPMSGVQAALYADAVAAYRSAKDGGEGGGGTQILGLLAKLRMVCANPLGVENGQHETKPMSEHLASSPKLKWLVRRLERIRDRGEKAIVFTEFRDLQRLVQRAVGERFAYPAQIINGGTTVDPRSEASRQGLIDRFQAEPGFGVIILSTTAVGFGVNIQAANHVIHFTRPWNPAKEDQATDRAYRIGQTRDVHVYCPTVVGVGYESFEQRLSSLLANKRELSRDMLAGTQEVTAEDFVDL